jgi:hypothetical protein
MCLQFDSEEDIHMSFRKHQKDGDASKLGMLISCYWHVYHPMRSGFRARRLCFRPTFLYMLLNCVRFKPSINPAMVFCKICY